MKNFKWAIRRRHGTKLLLAVLVALIIKLSISAPVRAFDIIDVIRGTVEYIQVSNISDEQEIEIGKQTNQQVLSQYRLSNNSQIQQYVRSMGQDLLRNSNSRDIPFVFQVVDSDEVNAFATPGGYVYVTTGLMKTAENRAQLASVMGHEIAHVNEKHGVRRLKQAVAAKGIAGVAGVETSQLAQIAYQVTLDLPQSRSFEYEADSSGLKILQQSGYPAAAFANFLAKLEGGGGTPEFIRTHPTSENRIKAIAPETKGISNGKGQNSQEYRNQVLSLL
ncbi:MAG: M48 family metallopeptidase [Cyanobacteria bacterium J06621_12]